MPGLSCALECASAGLEDALSLGTDWLIMFLLKVSESFSVCECVELLQGAKAESICVHVMLSVIVCQFVDVSLQCFD